MLLTCAVVEGKNQEGRKPHLVTPPRETSFSVFMDTVDQRGKDVHVTIGPDVIFYEVDGHVQRTAVLPASVPFALVEAIRKAGASIATAGPRVGLETLVGLALSLAPAVGLLSVVLVNLARLQRRGLPPSVSKPTAVGSEGFKDAAGLEAAKAELEEVVEMLRNPSRFEGLGIRCAKGVLLVGPPGSGKTLLARALAAEAGVAFYACAGSELHASYVGEGAARVRTLFSRARAAQQPAIIFIDEVDAVGIQRGGSVLGGDAHREHDSTLTQLLACMDGAQANDRILVVAATNRYDVLDPALTRPGRFDRVVRVPLPGARSREKILALHASKLAAGVSADLAEVARETRGFSGAQLAGLVNEAALRALRRGSPHVQDEDFQAAARVVRR